MTTSVFVSLLLAVSVFTSLVVEAIKKFLEKKQTIKYSSNLIAGIVAIVLGAVVGIFYCVMAEVAFSAQIVIILIALIFLSWLCAMVGYDKVIQSLTQIGFLK